MISFYSFKFSQAGYGNAWIKANRRKKVTEIQNYLILTQ